MIIGLTGDAPGYIGTIQDIIWLFFPGAELIPGERPNTYINLELGQAEGTLWSEAQFYQDSAAYSCREEGVPVIPEEAPNEVKRLARLAIYRSLQGLTGQDPSPWGIMTGIRPTKVVHRLMDYGWPQEEIASYLRDSFALREDKALLITGIAENQRPFLLNAEQRAKYLSIYIGIPFCPTRCLYCSFPSYSIKRHHYMVEPFFQALMEEIKAVGCALREADKIVQTIYLGGGTPTSLNLTHLSALLKQINLYLRAANTVEFTVEGGRPDTLSPEVLSLLAAQGVDRISINPQSMVEKTLKVIGRSHTISDIYQAVESARKLKFKTINTDLIIGLPGETLEDVRETIRHVTDLAPENLTVHCLALKRASDLKQRLEEFPQATAEASAAMWQETARGALALGQEPYYMYRQKQMVGNLENIGYSLPGHQCIYNIQMIEERQTIIGLGVGAGSKWVDPKTLYLQNEYNAKEPKQYVDRLQEYLNKKISRIGG